MLKAYRVESQQELDGFISRSMSLNNPGPHIRTRNSQDWMFAQPDCGRVTFPANFVVVRDYRINLATIQFLQ